MNQTLLFAQQFMKNQREIGSIIPSSSYLVNTIIKNIDFSQDNLIIELGFGTGVITKHLLKKSSPNSKIYCVDINKNLFNYVKNNFKDNRLFLFNEDIRKLRLPKADYIISSLPFRNFTEETRNEILSKIQNYLKNTFILYQYTIHCETLLKKYFNVVKKIFVLRNIPPAYVYICKNKKTTRL